MKFKIPLLCLLAASTTLVCRADYKKGDSAFTKRLETALLAEPAPLADPVAKIDFAQELKVEEVRSSWLRVSIKKPKAGGWVYAGNVADEEPVIPPATGITANTASKTTTAAAARPLTKIAEQYAQAHGQPTEANDWLSTFSATVTDEDVTRYLVENKKGEYKQ